MIAIKVQHALDIVCWPALTQSHAHVPVLVSWRDDVDELFCKLTTLAPSVTGFEFGQTKWLACHQRDLNDIASSNIFMYRPP